MDEIGELSGRSVETQFQVDRLSSQTLALVYQRLVAETTAEKGSNRGIQRLDLVDKSAFQIAEVMP